MKEATSFNPYDAPLSERLDGTESKQDQFRRLRYQNTLRWSGKWRDERERTERAAHDIVASIAGQLELTRYQREESLRVFENLPDTYNQAYSTAMLALIVCGLIARQDGRDYHPNAIHPQSKKENEFTALADDIGVDHGQLFSCWRRIKREVLEDG